MKLRILFALCALFAMTADASAGPIRDRIKARFGGSCQPCGQSSCAPQARAVPAYLPPVQQAQYAQPVYQSFAAPASNCPGGVCPVPQQRFVFPRK